MIILAGGQTGVDRAAHRAAIEARTLCAGWCPPGREAEDGAIPPEFPLQSTPDGRSGFAPDIPRSQRTHWNVRDADALLVLNSRNHDPGPGTNFAIETARKLNRPVLIVDPHDAANIHFIRKWLAQNNVRILNIAGPAESTQPEIEATALAFLRQLFAGLVE